MMPILLVLVFILTIAQLLVISFFVFLIEREELRNRKNIKSLIPDSKVKNNKLFENSWIKDRQLQKQIVNFIPTEIEKIYEKGLKSLAKKWQRKNK